MIIVKIINQKIVQVAVANQTHGQQLLKVSPRNKKHLACFARTLVQSAPQSQKITNANNQQLIPIARNISFRQCRPDQGRRTNANVSYSISASSPTSSHFISADLSDQSFVIDETERESPFETLKRKAKDAVEKKGSAASAAATKYYGQSFNEALPSASERKLVVLMSWLEAKEKHIEKYRQFYLDRGFDVLNVKTSPLDLLLPNIGAKKISKDFVRFLVEKQYSNVVLHGFSVGGYMFGQVLLDIDKQQQEVREKILNSVRGLVFDSIVPFEGICVGVANSITQNPVAAKILENLLRLYLILGYRIATKSYEEASDKVWGGPLECPSLFLMSKDDKISDHKIIERLTGGWINKGIECHKMIVENSPHVQIFTKHNKEYVEKVESFLKRIKMS